MKRALILLVLFVGLTGCVTTTGVVDVDTTDGDPITVWGQYSPMPIR